MHEIICPHCNKAFTIDEAGYADILKQVRDREFEQTLHERLELADQAKQAEIDLAEARVTQRLEAVSAEKDVELEKMRAKLEGADLQQQVAVSEALSLVEKERDALTIEVNQVKREQSSAIALAEATLNQKALAVSTEKDVEIERLRASMANREAEHSLALTKAVNAVEQERDAIKGGLERAELEKKLAETALKDKYETQIRDRDDAIERLRDLKAKLSTKMVGETLEQHCDTEFNRIRATAFPYAYFEKDNDARTGSKGDFIFRDYDSQGLETVSVMFEMKNENDTTATKHKNEDFLKELDRDRTEKGCEYAVLVSLLEANSELYNSGIVDLSHRYPKMYVIRPQFFIPLLTLLRNAANRSLEYKSELERIKAQNIDITNFESELATFQSGFARNFDLAQRKFHTAIDDIDKAIDRLQRVKESLIGADRNLRLANDKAQDVSIKKLTRKNPTMAQKFDELSTLPEESDTDH